MSIVDRIDREINVAVITVSDTRTADNDKGGRLIQQYLKEINTVVDPRDYHIVKDDVTEIKNTVAEKLHEKIDAIITTGGTGIAKRDVTIEAVKSFFDKEIEGFGEIFRMLSYTEDIGSRSVLSRAVAGTSDNKIIISLPGSTGAIKLAMEKLVLPELNHLVYELNK